jgi:hypothetical protein
MRRVDASHVKTISVRVFVAHLVAYPVGTAWAFGAIPPLVVHVASRYGTSLDDSVLAHHVLLGLAWPVGITMVLEHLAGVFWGVDRDEKRGKRVFLVATAVLLAVPVLGGGASWIWLMTR